jgi:hypothetical protein
MSNSPSHISDRLEQTVMPNLTYRFYGEIDFSTLEDDFHIYIDKKEYRVISSSVVLYWCETLFLILREI